MKLERKEIKKIADYLNYICDDLIADGEVYDFGGQKLDIKFSPEFVLPSKWCIRAYNEENAKIIYPWFNKTFKHSWVTTTKSHHGYYGNVENMKPYKKTNTDYIVDGFTEITIEQFKKYVLNEW